MPLRMQLLDEHRFTRRVPTVLQGQTKHGFSFLNIKKQLLDLLGGKADKLGRYDHIPLSVITHMALLALAAGLLIVPQQEPTFLDFNVSLCFFLDVFSYTPSCDMFLSMFSPYHVPVIVTVPSILIEGFWSGFLLGAYWLLPTYCCKIWRPILLANHVPSPPSIRHDS